MSPLVNVIGHLPRHLEALPRFLERQIGVLERIDFDHSYKPIVRALYARPFFWLSDALRARRHRARQLEALRMSKDIAGVCRMLMFFIFFGQISEDELKQALLKVLNTHYEHPYAVSAKWNLNAILDQLQ